MNTTTHTAPPENLISPDKVMDVREIPCAIKHGQILRNCLDLAVGDHFILLNGHDPVRIHDQLSAAWPGAFAWEYLVQKPDEVRVKITKLNAVKPDSELPPGFTCSH